MTDIVIIIGLLAGLLMVATVCSVFYKSQVFGLGGSALSMLGTVLIGMSIWSNISFKIGADGGFSAELNQIKQEVAQIGTRNQRIEESVSEVKVEVQQTHEDIRDLQITIANFQASSNLLQDGIFGRATDASLRKHLKEIRASSDHEGTIEMVQEITGKNRVEAKEYIRDALR